METNSKSLFALSFLAVSLPAMAASRNTDSGRVVALVGGTVVDVSGFGGSSKDIPDATVLIRGAKIAAVGPRTAISIPAASQIVDVTGKYILPGLIDGFAGINSQGQASAHLYMGVTSIVASQDDRRGRLFLHAHPGPHVYLLDGTGSNDEYDLLADRPAWASKLNGHEGEQELSWEDTSRMMDEQARMGVRALWLGHNLTAMNTARIIAKARRLHMVTYGEFIATPYSEAINEGVTLLLHMTRYELGLVPAETQRQLAADPDGPGAGKAYASAGAIPPSDPRVADYAGLIARRRVALMPTLSLYYAMLPGHRNLWKDPIAAILDPKGVFEPPDLETGEPHYRSEESRQARQRMVSTIWTLNQAIARRHPRYLAATGCAVFGSLPGISMHTELELLVRLGLTPREALAAATNNYSEQFGWKELGLVAAGRRADLLILDADPVAEIANSSRIHMVLMDGAIVDRQALLHPPR